MKLFTVYLRIVVTLKNKKDGKRRDEPSQRRLALLAEDADDARARALAWLDAKLADPELVALDFGSGTREAAAVKLDRRDRFEPVHVYEEAAGVVELR